MKRPIAALGVLALALSLSACGDDDTSTTGTTSPTTAPTTTSAAPTTTAPGATQPAIWPAADVVFATPEEAAEDFVATVLDVPPDLGEFQQGDARSGEIEVYSRGEAGAKPVVRSVLLLRQLGPDDGWFVVGAVNENAAITSPAALDEVSAAVIDVEGVGRGFEANVVVTAHVAGSAEPLDQAVTMGGSMETPEPFRVQLDLSDAAPGDVVMLLVRGGVGLETDPGDFGAIPVVVAG